MHPLWTIWGKRPEYRGETSGVRAKLFDMIDECTTVNNNMVIAKPISRVDRNTQDSLKYIRQHKEQSISVYFEEEYIVTALYLISTPNTKLARTISRSLSLFEACLFATL